MKSRQTIKYILMYCLSTLWLLSILIIIADPIDESMQYGLFMICKLIGLACFIAISVACRLAYVKGLFPDELYERIKKIREEEL